MAKLTLTPRLRSVFRNYEVKIVSDSNFANAEYSILTNDGIQASVSGIVRKFSIQDLDSGNNRTHCYLSD